MKTAYLTFILAIIPTMLFASNIKTKDLPQETLYKNWLVSRCLGKATDSESTRQDAFRSASAYLEFSKLPIDAFEQGDKLATQYLTQGIQGSVKGSYHTVECLTLSQSQEAENIFNKYLNNE